MKILALEKEISGITDDRFTPDILREEAHRVWELYQSGIIREMYFHAEKEDAVLILECPSTGEAQSVLESLPLVQAGLLRFTVIPLKAYPGFERLFKER